MPVIFALQGISVPIGSHTPTRCPPGTFSPQIGNTNISDCLSCLPGSFCFSNGLSAVSGPCDAGYYCSRGAVTSQQVALTTTGGPCGPGTYCLSGSFTASPCPLGTYSMRHSNDGNITHQYHQTFCDLCKPGYVCDSLGLQKPNKLCGNGSWCALGAPQEYPDCRSATCKSMYGKCPKGSFCPLGSTQPNACQPGSYQNGMGQSFCKPCPSGYHCEGNATVTPSPCPQGSFCP